MSLLRNRETIGPALAFAVVSLALVVAACVPRSPEPTPTPTPTPTPEQVEEVTPTPDEASFSGTIVINGRPYVRETLSDGAVLHYEPWIQFATLQQVTDTYFRTKEMLRREFRIEEPPLPEIYVLFPEQFQHFVEEGEFTNPVFLAGLSSHIFRDGEVSDAKVYVNANGQELFRNVAHELAHPATPNVPTWLSEGAAEYIASRVQAEADPAQARFRVLDSRGRVRRALQSGDLMDLQELRDFSWKEAERLQELELAYAESWQLVEYMARATSTRALAHLMESHREDEPEEGDPFLDSLGITSEALWEGFTKGLVGKSDRGGDRGRRSVRLGALGQRIRVDQPRLEHLPVPDRPVAAGAGVGGVRCVQREMEAPGEGRRRRRAAGIAGGPSRAYGDLP